MKLFPIRFITTESLNKKIASHRKEQMELTQELYHKFPDAARRFQIDERERTIIMELQELLTERQRRGRSIAEKLGLIKKREVQDAP